MHVFWIYKLFAVTFLFEIIDEINNYIDIKYIFVILNCCICISMLNIHYAFAYYADK